MDLDQALEFASCTDPGMVRSHNEDSIAADPARGLVVLADGMGGYNAGEVASGMATTVLSAEMQHALQLHWPLCRELGVSEPLAHRIFADQIAKANTSIYQAAQSQPQYAGMGTTLVAAMFYDNRITVAHIGDSRLYRLRAEQLEQLTRDHSLLQEQIDSGMISAEQARFSQNKNLVTRALGIDPMVEAEVHSYDVQIGDIYLLCSDGLNDMVSDEDMGMTLQTLSANLRLAAQQLVQMANDNGGRDNVSVVLARVTHDFGCQRGWVDRLLGWMK